MDNQVLERVLHLSRSMAETRSLTPLLDYAMDEAMDLVGAKRGYIVLLREDGSLDFRVKRGAHHDGTPLGEDQVSTSILREVIQTRQPLIVSDARSDSRWSQAKSVALLGLRSVMCVPLIARGQTIGAMYVENRAVQNCFDAEDLPPFVLFANQAAVSIENAALNDELEARIAARTRELEQAKAQLEQSWLQAVEANRLRTARLSNVAHDIRAPLSIVLSSLELTLDGTLGDLTADQQEWLGKSFEAASLVLNLTNDLLDLTKIELGRLVLSPQEVNPNELLAKIYNIGLGLPWSPGVELQLDIAPDLPTMVVDPKRMTQVLVNLLANAVKFTGQGCVTLYAYPLTDSSAVVFGVRDTGEGIPSDKLDELFQRFHQVDNNPKRRQLGTGLGLAICRDLVELHGGRIWVESTPQVGSDFKFILPVRGATR